jgi:diguanylate cyclase (GGDEF)-like protein
MSRPVVLVVEPDPAIRRLFRVGLEVDGARVLESASAAQAHELLSDRLAAAEVTGVIALDEVVDDLRGALPDVPVVVTSSEVRCEDVQDVIGALRLPEGSSDDEMSEAVSIVMGEAVDLAQRWRELCRWDPLLPPEATPPVAEAMVETVGEALGRPQPLGWGPDPEVEKVAEVFAIAVGSVEAAVGELVCLREVLRRRLAGALAPDEETETLARLHMIVDRAMGVAVARVAVGLEQQAYVDSLTGLLNRRALERDLRRETARAARYGRRFSVVLLDLDRLKVVNDSDGHAAGDALLRGLSGALGRALRSGDAAYRIGGDEFVIVLPETSEETVEAVVERVQAAGAPSFGWGAAVFPDDSEDGDRLVCVADERMIAARAAARR